MSNIKLTRVEYDAISPMASNYYLIKDEGKLYKGANEIKKGIHMVEYVPDDYIAGDYYLRQDVKLYRDNKAVISKFDNILPYKSPLGDIDRYVLAIDIGRDTNTFATEYKAWVLTRLSGTDKNRIIDAIKANHNVDDSFEVEARIILYDGKGGTEKLGSELWVNWANGGGVTNPGIYYNFGSRANAIKYQGTMCHGIVSYKFCDGQRFIVHTYFKLPIISNAKSLMAGPMDDGSIGVGGALWPDIE